MNLTSDDRTWGMLAHLLTLAGYVVGIGQYIVPLVIFLVYKDKSRFVAFHALQSLYFRLLTLVLYTLCGILFCLILPVFLIIVIALAELVYTILLAIKANEGELAEYPIAGGWARRSVGI